jgi:hypothetical protein
MISISRNHADGKGKRQDPKSKPETRHAVASVPIGFNARQSLPIQIRVEHEPAEYLLGLIQGQMAHTKGEPIPLYSPYLRKVLGKNSANIIRALADEGHIVVSPHQAGSHSRLFVLGEMYRNSKFEWRRLTDKRLVRRINGAYAEVIENERQRWKLAHHLWWERQQKLGIDWPQAMQILDGLDQDDLKFGLQYLLVERIKMGLYRMSIDDQGRLYNSITNVKRELRPSLRMDDETLIELDMKCSQPSLLALTMGRDPELNRYLDGYHGYCDLVGDGELYEFIGRESGLVRDKAKHGLLVFLGKRPGSYPPCKVERVMAEFFPGVCRYVLNCNREDRGELLRELQRQESGLVVERVGEALPEGIYAMTLHDAYYVPKRFVEQVEMTFQNQAREKYLRLEVKPNVTGFPGNASKV